MLIALVVFIVLMMFWAFTGAWTNWDPTRPYLVGNTIIPWLCVAILGWMLFRTLP